MDYRSRLIYQTNNCKYYRSLSRMNISINIKRNNKRRMAKGNIQILFTPNVIQKRKKL